MVKSSSGKICTGDRCQHFGGGKGTIIAINKGLLKYQVQWDNGKIDKFTTKEFSKWCEILPPEPEPDNRQEMSLDLVPPSPEIHTRNLDTTIFSREKWKVGDRVQLKNTKLTGTIADPDKGLINWDDGSISTHNLSSTYLKKCSDNLTSVQASASGSPLHHSSSENLPLLAYASAMNIAGTSSSSDTQECQSKKTLKPWTAHTKQSKLSQPRPRANRSRFKEKGSEPMTSETVSPQSLKRSRQLNLNFSASKTCEDSLVAHGNQDTEPEPTSTIFSVTFPAAGTMSNGKWSAADILERPSLESDYFWLESPGALSSDNSRAPGQSKLENQLKKLEYLQSGECINPAFLEDAFTIPLGWCDRLVSRSAIQLLEEKGRYSETVSTPESRQSHSSESSTSEVKLPESDSLEKPGLRLHEFYVTVPAGIERPELMPDNLCYLFVASSFWNRSRAKIKSFPRPPKFPKGARTAADAGGYIAARDWGGKYPYTPDQYIEWLIGWCNGWAATMDYPCEPPLTGGDRRKIQHRQKQTTKLAWHFWNTYRDAPWQWVPTIQGWDTEDYIRHASELKPLIEEMRQHYGESFRVGIGTLCSRTSNAQIKEIVEAISTVLPGINFHLWGVKQNAASVVKSLSQVISFDSAAWDGLAGSRCRKIWEEEYREKISQAEYSWTIALPKYLSALEKKLGESVHNLGDRSNSLEKPETPTTKQSGSLYQYTANKADKFKAIHTYPKVEGDRKREEDSHWYWGFSYVEKEQGKWRDKSAAVPRKKLAAVRAALRDDKPYTYILQEVLGKN